MKKKLIQLLSLVTICSISFIGLVGCAKEEINKDSQLNYITDFDEVAADGTYYDEYGEINLEDEDSEIGNGLKISGISKKDIEVLNEEDINEMLKEEIGEELDFWSYSYKSSTVEDGTYNEITKISTFEAQEKFRKERPEHEEIFGFKEEFYKNGYVYVIHILNNKLHDEVHGDRMKIVDGTLIIDGSYKQILGTKFPYESAYLTLTIDKKFETDIIDVKFRLDGLSQKELKIKENERKESVKFKGE